MSSAAAEPEGDPGRLPFRTKAIYATGDHTINLGLASMLFVFPFFLTDIAGIPATTAAWIPLIGRTADAFSDPLMGRLSDQTRWRMGRRRPYFLLGMVPFGVFYAACWANTEGFGETAAFAYYIVAYVLFSLSTTVIAVPYLALIPELTSDYDERTSINAFRGVGAILGALLAAAFFRPLASAFGGGPAGFMSAGIAAGIWAALFWPAIFAVTREPTDRVYPKPEPLFRTALTLAKHVAFRRLTGLYILGRIAIDLSTTMFAFYFAWCLSRPDDFEITFTIFLVTVALSMPAWSVIARRMEKRTIFLIGAASWLVSQAFLFMAEPEWPRFWIFAGAAIGGLGYAAADMIPWSMLGEVVDEDEVNSGDRREGIYFGLFMFLRKLGGALASSAALALIGLAGYDGLADSQPESAVTAIRYLTAAAPAAFVLLAAFVARGFPITRERHAEILATLEARRSGTPGPTPVAPKE